MSSKKRKAIIERQLDAAMQQYKCWQKWNAITNEIYREALSPYDLCETKDESERFDRLLRYMHKLAHQLHLCHCEYKYINTDLQS